MLDADVETVTLSVLDPELVEVLLAVEVAVVAVLVGVVDPVELADDV